MQGHQHDSFSPSSSSSAAASSSSSSSPFTGTRLAGSLQTPPPPSPFSLQEQQSDPCCYDMQLPGHQQLPSLYYHEPLQPVAVARPFRMRVEPKVVIFQVS